MHAGFSLRAYAAALAVVTVGLAAIAPAPGKIVEFKLSTEFSGAANPEGPSPWLTATFDDHDTPGSVDLTLENTNLLGSEFVFGWYFNLEPALEPTDLVFSPPGKLGAFSDPTIHLEKDAFKADGDGWFDILFEFSSGGGMSARFGAGEAATYSISGIPNLTADSFYHYSVLGRSTYTGLLTAAHVGGIGTNGECSGWITVPEPASLLMALAGLTLLPRRRG